MFHPLVGRSSRGRALLRLVDFLLDLLRSFGVELHLVWSQFPEKPEELARVNALFVSDVLEDLDREDEFLIRQLPIICQP